LDEIARTIEFSPIQEAPDDKNISDYGSELDISSPFDTLLSDIFDSGSSVRTLSTDELESLEPEKVRPNDESVGELEELGPVEPDFSRIAFNGSGKVDPSSLEPVDEGSKGQGKRNLLTIQKQRRNY